MAVAGAAEGSARSHGCGVWACGTLWSGHKSLPTAFGCLSGAAPLLPPSLRAQKCPSLCCTPLCAHLCWSQPKMLLGLGKHRGAGPRPLVPTVSLRHVAAGWIFHGTSSSCARRMLHGQRRPPRACAAPMSYDLRLRSHGKTSPPNVPWAGLSMAGQQMCAEILGDTRKAFGKRHSWERDSTSLGREGSSWGQAVGRHGQGEGPKLPGSGNCSLD